MAGITRFGVPLLFRGYSQERKEYIEGIWIDGKGDCIVEKDGSVVEVSGKSVSQLVYFDEEGMKVWEREFPRMGSCRKGGYRDRSSSCFRRWKGSRIKESLCKEKKQMCEKEIG